MTRLQATVLLFVGLAVALPARGQDLIGAAAKATKRPLNHLSTVEITLERTGCFGSCSAYIVQICGHDRSVRYFGEAAEHDTSSFLRSSLDVDELYDLLERFYRVRFFDLPDEYDLTPYILHAHGDAFVVLDSYTTDLPSTYLQVTVGNKTKRIRLRVGEPAELRALAAEIDALVGTAALFGSATPPN